LSIEESSLTRFAVDRNFWAGSELDPYVEFLSVEVESPYLGWVPLPEDQPVHHKRMVILPSPPKPHRPEGSRQNHNRQSARREDGICNKWGQAHDIKNLFISDGSQFTTGAAANPTLTIVALAIRQADFIADQVAKQQL
jgi:hypothetical protein